MIPGLYDKDDNLLIDWKTLKDKHFKIKDGALINIKLSVKTNHYKLVLSDEVSELNENFDLFDSLRIISGRNVAKVGENVFKYSLLEEVDFPNLQEVGDSAFENSSILKKIDIKNIIRLSKKCFLNCKELDNLEFNKDVTIRKFALQGTKYLNKRLKSEEIVILNKTLIRVTNNYKNKELIIPEYIDTIAGDAFLTSAPLEVIKFPKIIKSSFVDLEKLYDLKEVYLPLTAPRSSFKILDRVDTYVYGSEKTFNIFLDRHNELKDMSHVMREPLTLDELLSDGLSMKQSNEIFKKIENIENGLEDEEER